eukprot:c38272_g1_i1.p1 GENE.c38272_g1_i1~~c38272_g1_i1.p1  ORF type:complete len:143 (-),score=64.86 c38272_g1_i1:15-407(-)
MHSKLTTVPIKSFTGRELVELGVLVSSVDKNIQQKGTIFQFATEDCESYVISVQIKNGEKFESSLKMSELLVLQEKEQIDLVVVEHKFVVNVSAIIYFLNKQFVVQCEINRASQRRVPSSLDLHDPNGFI